jgi:hypothetical protein
MCAGPQNWSPDRVGCHRHLVRAGSDRPASVAVLRRRPLSVDHVQCHPRDGLALPRQKERCSTPPAHRRAHSERRGRTQIPRRFGEGSAHPLPSPVRSRCPRCRRMNRVTRTGLELDGPAQTPILPQRARDSAHDTSHWWLMHMLRISRVPATKCLIATLVRGRAEARVLAELFLRPSAATRAQSDSRASLRRIFYSW